ncbi:hypothetical protein G9A89_003461 [Geosiphon pyriformis]|nr:hypothetical protein G9A89_003461 [Geosiphon pyriformis]
MATLSNVPLLTTSISLVLHLDVNMILDNMTLTSAPPLPAVNDMVHNFSSSFSKVLTSKMGRLESKMVAFEVSIGLVLESELVWRIAMCNIRDMNNPVKQKDIVYWHMESGNMISIITETKLKSGCRPWIMNKFDGVKIFSSGLDKGFFGAEVAIIMNNSLAHYVSKVEEVSGRVISVCLLFKDKLSVTVLGLYAGASSGTRFGQALEINSFIVRALNSSTFVVLDGNFNEDNSRKSASFRFCLNLGLVNSFGAHLLVRVPTWNNSRGIEKTIDYIFVSDSLSSAVAGRIVTSVSDYFDTDHKAVMVSVGLGELLDIQLNGLHKQANKDQWKFKIVNADGPKWACFKECSLVRFSAMAKDFLVTSTGRDFDFM